MVYLRSEKQDIYLFSQWKISLESSINLPKNFDSLSTIKATLLFEESFVYLVYLPKIHIILFFRSFSTFVDHFHRVVPINISSIICY